MPPMLSTRFAFQYNPSLQPRALVVFGCISKRVTHGQIKQIIRILSKASPLLSIDRVCVPSLCPAARYVILYPDLGHLMETTS